MPERELTYNAIEMVLLAEFPELTDRIENEFGSYYNLKSEIPSAYPVFEGPLRELIFEQLSDGDSGPILKRVFLFLEEMATSQDTEVVNLLWIANLEPLVFEANALKRAWKYMGGKTRDLAQEIARRRGWEENLPTKLSE